MKAARVSFADGMASLDSERTAAVQANGKVMAFTPERLK